MGRTVAAGVRSSSGARRADSLKHFAYLGVQTPIPAQPRTGSKRHFRRCKKYARGTRATHARHRLSDFDVLPPRCELQSPKSHRQQSLAHVQSMQKDVPLCCVVNTRYPMRSAISSGVGAMKIGPAVVPFHRPLRDRTPGRSPVCVTDNTAPGTLPRQVPWAMRILAWKRTH